MKFERILIPTDGSETAKMAVEKGLSLAKSLNVKVLALYVANIAPFSSFPPDLMSMDIGELLKKEGNDILSRVRNRAKEMGMEIKTMIREGDPSEEICEEARKNDLIIIGTKGRTGLERIFLGSVAEKVVHHAPCPVMVVREK